MYSKFVRVWVWMRLSVHTLCRWIIYIKHNWFLFSLYRFSSTAVLCLFVFSKHLLLCPFRNEKRERENDLSFDEMALWRGAYSPFSNRFTTSNLLIYAMQMGHASDSLFLYKEAISYYDFNEHFAFDCVFFLFTQHSWALFIWIIFGWDENLKFELQMKMRTSVWIGFFEEVERSFGLEIFFSI